MLSLWPFLFVVLGILDPVIDAGPARNTFTEERLGQRTSWDLEHNKAVSTIPRDHYVRRFGNSPIESRTTLSRRESMLETSAPDWRIIINHWMAFDPSSNSISNLSSMYAGIRSRVNQKFGLSAPRRSVFFSYGSLSLTFQSLDEVVPWESIETFSKTMETSLKRSGLVALYFVTLHLARGSIITVILGVGWHGIRAQLYPEDYDGVRTDWVRTNLIE